MSRTVHSLQGSTGPILKMWEEGFPELSCEDLTVYNQKSNLQDICLSTFLKKSASLSLDLF